MSYDYFITKGSIRLAEAPVLVSKLLRFAMHMELEVIPVNWLVSGAIVDLLALAWLKCGDAESLQERANCRLVSRPVGGETNSQGLGYAYGIENEHVQGIVFCHPYAQWVFTWNVSRGGLLAEYYQYDFSMKLEYNEFFDPRGATQAGALLERIDEVMNAKPVEVRSSFSEEQISILCPWRRSDVAAACDLLGLVAYHSDNFEANDHYGVWPNKDFSRWRNLAGEYAEGLGGSPAHPDPMDLLSEKNEEQPTGDNDD